MAPARRRAGGIRIDRGTDQPVQAGNPERQRCPLACRDCMCGLCVMDAAGGIARDWPQSKGQSGPHDGKGAEARRNDPLASVCRSWNRLRVACHRCNVQVFDFRVRRDDHTCPLVLSSPQWAPEFGQYALFLTYRGSPLADPAVPRLGCSCRDRRVRQAGPSSAGTVPVRCSAYPLGLARRSSRCSHPSTTYASSPGGGDLIQVTARDGDGSSPSRPLCFRG